jgi:hypothetical protein
VESLAPARYKTVNRSGAGAIARMALSGGPSVFDIEQHVPNQTLYTWHRQSIAPVMRKAAKLEF